MGSVTKDMPELSLRTIFSLGGLTLVFVLLLSVISLLLAVHPPRFRSSVTPGAFGWRHDSLTLHTSDGLDLAAWYIPAVAGRPEEAVIVLHGYPFDKGNVLTVTPFLHQRYDLLLFDFRSFGESQGRVSTLGIREELDLLAGLDYLVRERGKSKIGLYGFSLGAAIALQTAPKGAVVRAVVADSPYATLEMMALDRYNAFWVLRYPLAWLTLTLARLYPGVDPRQTSPLRAAGAWGGPVLLIHGKLDTQIGVHHAHTLQTALRSNPKAQVWLVEDADHAQAWALQQKDYESRVLAFFEEHLGRLRNRE